MMRNKLKFVIYIMLTCLALCDFIGWLAPSKSAIYAQEKMFISGPDLSKSPDEISWTLNYTDSSPIDLEQLSVKGSMFSQPEVSENGGIRIAIYLDLWKYADLKGRRFSDADFQAAVKPLSGIIQRELGRQWNPQTDKIALYSTHINREALPENSPAPGSQSVWNLHGWQHDLGKFVPQIDELNMGQHIGAEYNHAQLTQLLSKNFLADPDFMDASASKRLIILISDGHDFELHSKQYVHDPNSFVKGYAYSEASIDAETKAITKLLGIYKNSNITIQPVYVLPVNNGKYHGRRFMRTLSEAFGTNLIDVAPNTNEREPYKNEIGQVLQSAMDSVKRSATVTFTAKQFSSLMPTIQLVDQNGKLVGNSTQEIQLDLSKYLPTEQVAWTRIPTDVITSTVTYRSGAISWPSPPLPTLAEQQIQYELSSVIKNGESISRTILSEEFVSIVEDNRLEVQFSSLPKGNYELKLSSMNPSISQRLPAIENFTVTQQPKWPQSALWLLAGLGLLLLLWAFQWLIRQLKRTPYNFPDEDTTVDIPVSVVGDGAILDALPPSQNRHLIGRLLLIYGMDAAQVVELSNEAMNFGAYPNLAQVGRNICLSPVGTMNALQFNIRPMPSKRLEIRDIGSAGSNNVNGSRNANVATSNQTAQVFETYLNNTKVASVTDILDTPTLISSGDIIRVGNDIKYRVVLNERYAGVRTLRSRNGLDRARQFRGSIAPIVSSREPAIHYGGDTVAHGEPEPPNAFVAEQTNLQAASSDNLNAMPTNDTYLGEQATMINTAVDRSRNLGVEPEQTVHQGSSRIHGASDHRLRDHLKNGRHRTKTQPSFLRRFLWPSGQSSKDEEQFIRDTPAEPTVPSSYVSVADFAEHANASDLEAANPELLSLEPKLETPPISESVLTQSDNFEKSFLEPTLWDKEDLRRSDADINEALSSLLDADVPQAVQSSSKASSLTTDNHAGKSESARPSTDDSPELSPVNHLGEQAETPLVPSSLGAQSGTAIESAKPSRTVPVPQSKRGETFVKSSSSKPRTQGEPETDQPVSPKSSKSMDQAEAPTTQKETKQPVLSPTQAETAARPDPTQSTVSNLASRLSKSTPVSSDATSQKLGSTNKTEIPNRLQGMEDATTQIRMVPYSSQDADDNDAFDDDDYDEEYDDS